MGEKIEYKGQKLANLKKKGIFRPKKQAGAELKKKKKEFFAPKIDQFSKKKKKKREISGQKNKLGLSLRTKKGLFLAKFKKKRTF